MIKKFYKDFDKIYSEIREFLCNYNKSTILQNYFLSAIESLFYGNIINNFFTNLNQKNVIKYNLPKGEIGKIKNKYNNIQKNARLAISLSLKNKKIDEYYYNNFKFKIKREFPEFFTIISEIEKEINIKEAKSYLKKKEKEIRKVGKSEEDLNAFFITKPLEIYVQKEKCFPIGTKLDKLMKLLINECFPKYSQEVMKALKKSSKEMLNHQRNNLDKFEYRLYKKWEEPLDLLECLIVVSTEAGEKHKDKLSKTANNTNNVKREAIIKIHARSLQISNEILVLLKAGYTDGANARWRSSHEIAVISIFLLDNNNEVSKRYLEHEIVKKFKEAKDYRACYRKLGYLPIQRKEFNMIKREHDKLIAKYGNEFKYVNGFEWIPKTILPNRNFRALEEYVKLEKWHSYYNLSCNSVHGGASGFYRLGLMDDYQDKLLLVGPSDYGLSIPIKNAAVSLLITTMCLLNLGPDFESIIQIQIMNSYINEIKEKNE